MLELGSGTGLVGLVAGMLGADVCITDQACVPAPIPRRFDVDGVHVRPLLPSMERNVALNNLSDCVSVLELNWSSS